MKSPAVIKQATRKTRVLDRDDDLGHVVQCIVNSELPTGEIAHRARELGWSISPATMERWIDGKVSRPQNYTVEAAMAGLGWVKKWVYRPRPVGKPH